MRLLFNSGTRNTFTQFMDFEPRIQEGVKANKTDTAGYYTWGASVLKHESTYVMLMNEWIAGSPNTGDFEGWIYYNRIYRLTSNSLTGPYSNKTELTELRQQTWSAGAVMNPQPIYYNGLWYMFYAGTIDTPQVYPIIGEPGRENQQIGISYCEDPINDSWTVAPLNPIIPPRAGEIDSTITNNPVPFIGRDGKLRCIYKSYVEGSSPENKIFMVARLDGDILDPQSWTDREEVVSGSFELEDATVWLENDKYYMIAKSFDAVAGVGSNEGILFESNDGDNWELSDNPLAYTLTIDWTDASSDTYTRIERAYVYKSDTEMALFTAVQEPTNAFNIGRVIT